MLIGLLQLLNASGLDVLPYLFAVTELSLGSKNVHYLVFFFIGFMVFSRRRYYLLVVLTKLLLNMHYLTIIRTKRVPLHPTSKKVPPLGNTGILQLQGMLDLHRRNNGFSLKKCRRCICIRAALSFAYIFSPCRHLRVRGDNVTCLEFKVLLRTHSNLIHLTLPTFKSSWNATVSWHGWSIPLLSTTQRSLFCWKLEGVEPHESWPFRSLSVRPSILDWIAASLL